jgi:CDP-diacylglycerol--serine O-phosphatidyltransferase
VAVLPALMTLANGVCGLAAVHAVIPGHESAAWVAGDPFLTAAAYLGLAMLADMLDGRIARFTRQTTDFGGQLDSLCDAVSFGAAPSVLVYMAVTADLRESLPEPFAKMFGQFAWVMGAAYFCCAALRLARFNVENVHDESAHFWFKGLPSPGAAAAVAALLLLRHALAASGAAPVVRTGFALALPLLAMTLGLMMVSTFSYPHIVNQYLHRRTSFGYLARLVSLMVALLAVLLLTRVEFAVAAAVLAYAYGGTVAGLSRRAFGLPPVTAVIKLGSPAATPTAAPETPVSPSVPPSTSPTSPTAAPADSTAPATGPTAESH